MDYGPDDEAFAPSVPRDFQANLMLASARRHLNKRPVHHKRYIEQLEKNHQSGSHRLALLERPKITVQD
jgi:hypothetical protein